MNISININRARARVKARCKTDALILYPQGGLVSTDGSYQEGMPDRDLNLASKEHCKRLQRERERDRQRERERDRQRERERERERE
jgi:hypothetical protein